MKFPPHARPITTLALAFALFGLEACLPAEADYRFGLGTSEIVGIVDTDGGAPDPDKVLIVIFQHHYLFETVGGQEKVYRVSAALNEVDRHGRFVVHMPSDVVTLELLFIAPDRLTEEFKFNRQIGIGQVSYRASLEHHPNWHAHFYTYLQPMLSHLIVEPRYQMSLEDQKRLGDWLLFENARLDDLRRERAAKWEAS